MQVVGCSHVFIIQEVHFRIQVEKEKRMMPGSTGILSKSSWTGNRRPGHDLFQG